MSFIRSVPQTTSLLGLGVKSRAFSPSQTPLGRDTVWTIVDSGDLTTLWQSSRLGRQTAGLRGWRCASFLFLFLFFPGPPERKPAGRERDGPTQESRGEDPGREGEEARLPRCPGPEGETAACAGPAGGYSGGAERAGPEGEPRGHGCRGSAPSGSCKGSGTLLSQSHGKPGSIALAQPRPGGNFKPDRKSVV